MFVCECLKDGGISLDPPVSSPCVLVALPDASQRFHGVLEMEGDFLICLKHTHTHKEREAPSLLTNSQLVLLSCYSNSL